jgi:DNA polymerase-3 subunit delta'
LPLLDLDGQRPAVDALLRALGSGRLPHALLFTGPAGVGKREAAVLLAQAILCPDAKPDACGRCSSCRRAIAGQHPDLGRLERDGTFIKVEAARELVRTSALKPYEGRAKVYLVPEADCCNDESANTLLKTLEEPPAHTYLVLIADNAESVLPTLRSRCQAVVFPPLSRAALTRRLTAGGMAAAEAEERARLAQGSLARAQAIDLATHRKERAEAAGLIGSLARPALAPAAAERLLEVCEATARRPGGLESFLLGTVRGLARDVLLLASAADPALLLDAADLAQARALAVELGAGGASELLADIDRAEASLEVNANRRLLLEAVLLGVHERRRRTA